ncbi:MAG: diguanylate cyclase [Erythrobacter sp.]
MKRFADAQWSELVFGPDLWAPDFWLIAFAVFVTILAGHAILTKKRDKAKDPLNGLFKPENFEAQADAMDRRRSAPRPIHQPNRRSAAHAGTHDAAVLHGRIDESPKVRALWDSETRDRAIAHVAQVMRAGVRDGDVVSGLQGPDGDGSFVIIAPGASEAEASGIARRLLDTIAETRFDAHGRHARGAMRFRTSFGVAQRRADESDADVQARAASAMDAASGRGDDHIIVASDWEEVHLLPAPSSKGSSQDGSGDENGAIQAA